MSGIVHSRKVVNNTRVDIDEGAVKQCTSEVAPSERRLYRTNGLLSRTKYRIEELVWPVWFQCYEKGCFEKCPKPCFRGKSCALWKMYDISLYRYMCVSIAVVGGKLRFLSGRPRDFWHCIFHHSFCLLGAKYCNLFYDWRSFGRGCCSWG